MYTFSGECGNSSIVSDSAHSSFYAVKLKHRSKKKNTFLCEYLPFSIHVLTVHVYFLWIRDENHTASMTARVCLCVRTMCGALAGQCSVQCRREQRRPRPGQTQYPGNPCVFRSPGPYLMSLSKKKVALSRVLLSHCLPLTLLFLSFSHASPSFSSPSPGATLRMNGFQVFTQQLCLSLYIAQDFI